MLMRKGLLSSTRKNVVFATVAAVALTAAGPSFAASPGKATPTAATHRATDFSSARRYHHHRGGGSAAGLAAFAGVVGAIGSIAAAQSRRDAYDYYDGPAYYNGGPAYYGNSGYRYAAPYGGGYGGGNFIDPGGNIVPYQ